MDIRGLCHVCLGGSSKMFAITSPQLQDVYEKLTGTKLETREGLSDTLCYICYAQLRKCLGFLEAARRSNDILTEFYTAKTVSSQDVLHRPVHNYSITPTECFDVCTNRITEDNAQLCRMIKDEVVEEVPVDINESPEDIKSDPDVDSNSDRAPMEADSDSEDDVPLNTLRTDIEIRAEKPKRTYRKQSKLDAQVVILTKEQQIQDMQARATSLNYLNSPFPCVLCYRGFISHIAYRNHKERHEESSGAHLCEVCALRYRSARLLRTHAARAHARLYRCNRCDHLSHTKHQAHDHERWHNGHVYLCQLCGQGFAKRTSYLTHARARHGGRARAACAACGERFLSRHGLRTHRAKAHSAPRQEVEESSPAARFCAECNVEFESIRAWQRHILASSRHTLRAHQTKQCPLCGDQVSGSVGDHLKEHGKKLRPPPPRAPPPAARTLAQLTCEQCGASFLNKAKLTAHVKRVHLGFKYNKNIVCEICGKKCTSNAALKYHQRTHTGERPHACSACGKRFADTNQLKIHKRTHTGEKPYSCEHCAKTFAQKAALNRHYRVHTGAKPYTCEVCAKSFSQSNSLKGHVRSVHLKMPQYRKPRTAEVKMDEAACKRIE